MKNYNTYIISFDQLRNWGVKNIAFRNGFVIASNCDIWEKIQDHLDVPIVSIRPSGRNGWNEVIVLCANGYLRKDGENRIPVLQYNTLEDYKTVLRDIFYEFDVDERMVIDNYKFDCPESMQADIKAWVIEEY